MVVAFRMKKVAVSVHCRTSAMTVDLLRTCELPEVPTITMARFVTPRSLTGLRRYFTLSASLQARSPNYLLDRDEGGYLQDL